MFTACKNCWRNLSSSVYLQSIVTFVSYQVTIQFYYFQARIDIADDLAARNMERRSTQTASRRSRFKLFAVVQYAHFFALFLRIKQIWSTIATTVEKLEAVLVIVVVVPLESKCVAWTSVWPVKAVLLVSSPVADFVTFVR